MLLNSIKGENLISKIETLLRIYREIVLRTKRTQFLKLLKWKRIHNFQIMKIWNKNSKALLLTKCPRIRLDHLEKEGIWRPQL